jgi:cytochrome c
LKNAFLGAVVAILAAYGAANAAESPKGDPKHGENVFEACRACHAVDGVDNEVGPGLRGVFGRKAGTREDFRYSAAMKRSGITWTPETLDAFLADPQKAVPATRMPFDGLPDSHDRADVIAYMQQVFK